MSKENIITILQPEFQATRINHQIDMDTYVPYQCGSIWLKVNVEGVQDVLSLYGREELNKVIGELVIDAILKGEVK